MHGITRVNLGGQERVLRFNNFANIEIAKVLFKDETAKPDLPKFMEKLFELNAKNHFLLLKMLIYAGIIGNDYVVGFEESVSIVEVGEWVSDLSPDDSNKIWETFMEASGLTLADKEKEEVEETDTKKKHPSPTKKRYKKPLEN